MRANKVTPATPGDEMTVSCANGTKPTTATTTATTTTTGTTTTTTMTTATNGRLALASPATSMTKRQSAWDRAQAEYEQAAAPPGGGGGGAATTTTPAPPLDIRRALPQVFRTKQFAPSEEVLYQRYFFRLNQTNTTVTIGLVTVAGLLLIVCRYAGGSGAGGGGGSGEESAVSASIAGVVPGTVSVALAVTAVICQRAWMMHHHLRGLCHVTIGLFAAFVVGVAMTTGGQPPTDVWCSVYVIYLVYALLPVRMRVAVVSGVTLAALHVACACVVGYGETHLWRQVSKRYAVIVILEVTGDLAIKQITDEISKIRLDKIG